MHLVRKPVSERAIPYIRYALEQGTTLSHLLLNRLNLQDGIITTFVPEEFDPDTIENFNWGGVIPHAAVRYETDNQGRRWRYEVLYDSEPETTVPLILDYLLSHPRSLVMFQAWYLTPGELHRSHGSWRDRVSFFLCEQDVYCYTLCTQADAEKVEATIESQAYPPAVGVVASIDKVLFDQLNARLVIGHEGHLHRIIDGLHLLIIGAYDAEGYLVWEPQRRGLAKCG